MTIMSENKRSFTAGLPLVGLLLVLLKLLFFAPQTMAQEATVLSFDPSQVEAKAQALANTPYESVELAANSPLRALDYDDFRRIVFNPEDAIWKDQNSPFQLQLFHPGFLHINPVKLNLVKNGQAEVLPFSTDVFNYHQDLPDIDPDTAGGYAGFRVHYPINTSTRHEEFLVFLGASYFRGVGRDQFYGLSARGLAVNTVGPGGEEFPRFTEFWIETPPHNATDIIVHALLDSESITGAYHFRVQPGDSTQMDVEMTLFPRKNIERVGIAPLTSMFMFDASNRNVFDDFRSAVHDSDGLKIQQANGETIWRPLANPRQLQVSSFGKTKPTGFGLLQRHQEFSQYQDAEARYEKRTSLWIEPKEEWGEGEVVLVEIPSQQEINDNIVAFWQPTEGLFAGQSYRFAYRMSWGFEPGANHQGRVLETAAGAVDASQERLFVIDFSSGDSITNVKTDPDAVKINTYSSAGKITNVSGALVEATGNYRVYLKLDPAEFDLAELRVALEVDGAAWGETWLYRWTR